MNNLIFKIRSKLGRFVISHSNDPRPGSAPYLSGDSFRKLGDHIYEPQHDLDPSAVKERDTVFVESGLIDEFFQKIHPKIAFPYILITHNGDRDIGESEARHIDSKIIRWFAQNNTFLHKKITPLPIGLENLHYCNNGLTYLFDRLKSHQPAKTNNILYGFNVSTNRKVRESALETLRRLSFAKEMAGWPDPPRYLKALAGHRFVASPEGNGLDCHRTWEALYLGTIPIVLHSRAMEYFRDLGLPILLIDNWPELANYDEVTLEKKYQELIARKNDSALSLDYWSEQIKNGKS